MNIYEKLSNIQNELKAPKNQRNNFGNYNYRSAEDILEAVKPLCKKHGTTLTLSDNMLNIGSSVYVEATATLFDFEGNTIVVSASAREADTQKGMAPAQITGSSSSYARKYAMNGLFNIDDTKDDDFNNKHEKETKPTKPQPTYTPPSNEQDMFKIGIEKGIASILKSLDKDENAKYKLVTLKGVCQMYNVSSLQDIKIKSQADMDTLIKLVKQELDLAKAGI